MRENKTNIVMLDLDKIKTQISNGAIGQALDAMLQEKALSESFFYNDLILLKSRINQLNRNQRMGIVSNKEVMLERNQLVYSLLDLIKDIQKDSTLVKKALDTEALSPEKEEVTKILFLSSNPHDSSSLHLQDEMREIENNLRYSKNRDKFEMVFKGAVRIRDLQLLLIEENPHIVHFSGHGSGEGIYLQDEEGRSVLVPQRALGNLFKLINSVDIFKNGEPKISCVFLNACYAENQAKIIAEHIPFVIGMKDAVNNKTAIKFSSSFYEMLGVGNGIDFAFEFAKNALDLHDLPGTNIPVLLHGLNTDN